MSCTFWLRRKKLAAMQREQESASAPVEQVATKPAVAEKPVKKGGVKKNDEATD